MKRVWFVYKIIESMLGLCCLGYHACGFLKINYIQDHYVYVAVFGGFPLMSMFGCLSICLKESVSPLREALWSTMAACVYILVSINSMYHAEKDFHLMYLSADIRHNVEGDYQEIDDLSEEPHSFFKYSKAQSVAALICGCFYWLHAILAFDVGMAKVEETNYFEDNESDDVESIQHLPFYVFGKIVHVWLNKFQWFSSLADATNDEKSEALAEVR